MDTQARPKTRALQIVICSLGIHFQTISNVPSSHVLQIFSCRALPSLAPPVHVEYCPGHGAVTSTRFFFPLSPKAPHLCSPGTAPLLSGLTALKSPAPGAYVVTIPELEMRKTVWMHLVIQIKLPSCTEGTRQHFPPVLGWAGLFWALRSLLGSGGSLCVL